MSKLKEKKVKTDTTAKQKRKSLSGEIAKITGVILIFIFAALIVFTAISMRSSVQTAVADQFSEMSRGNGAQVQAVIDAASASASSLQDYILEAYDKEAVQTPEEAAELHKSEAFDVFLSKLNYEAELFIMGTAQSTVKNNDDIIGMGAFFEPYGYDPHIRDYSVYINNEDAVNNTVQNFGAYEEYSKNDYYAEAAKTQLPYFTSPYVDNGMTLVSACYPIVFSGKTQGVVLADLNVSNFSKINSTNPNYPSMYTSIIDETGTIVYDSSDAEAITTDYLATLTPEGLVGYNEGIARKEPFSVKGATYTRFYYPIETGTYVWWAQTAVTTKDLNAAVTKTTTALVIISILSLIALLLVITTVLKKKLKPIDMIVTAAERLSKGDLEIDLTYHKNNEIGELSTSFNYTAQTLKTIIGDVNQLLGEMGRGNFDIKTTCEDRYVGEFQNMLFSLRDINTNLSNTLSQIHESSFQVNIGAEQVSSAAQALSQGAVEQASSIEELSATITDIAEQVKQTSKNTQEASSESADAGTGVMTSNGQMTEMISAMNEITDKSNEIGKIIKTIEDIAFQTNILALNAAVEAARAGDAGKGFAVVADEVRNLATKSAEAAKNTTALIEQTVAAVSNGSHIANDTAQSLLVVVEKSSKVSALVDEIAKATVEQSTSINQVTLGVDQISAVVQNNSATAEESAAASEQLSAQADMLKTLVSQFTLKAASTSSSGYTPAKAVTPSVPEVSSKPSTYTPTAPQKRAEEPAKPTQQKKPETSAKSAPKQEKAVAPKKTETPAKPVPKQEKPKKFEKLFDRKSDKADENKASEKFTPIVESPKFETTTASTPAEKTLMTPKGTSSSSGSSTNIPSGVSINDHSDKY